MKFVGKNPKECFDKLMSKDYDKYFNADAKMIVPKDYYDGVIKEADEQIKVYQKQLESAQKRGDTTLAKDLKSKIEKCEKIKQNTKPSTLTNDEAIEARISPLKTTAIEMIKVSHEAGVQGAKYGAVIGGVFALLTNAYAICKGEKKLNEATLDILVSTGKAATVGYGSAFSGSLIGGLMKNSGNELLRNVSKTALPAAILSLTIESAKAIYSFANGEIDGVECMERMGQCGTNLVASSLGATIGQIAIPIPVVGGVIGGMVACTLTQLSYAELKNSLKNAKLARERRIAIEQECAELIKMHKEYQAYIEEIAEQYLAEHKAVFQQAFLGIAQSLKSDDMETFITSANLITDKVGGHVNFRTYIEFDEKMQSDKPFKF